MSDENGKDDATPRQTTKVAHTRARARESAIAEICAYLRSGLPKTMACDRAGIPRRTFYNWLADEDVAALVHQALAEGAQGALERIHGDLDDFDAETGRDRSRAANVRLHLFKMLYPDYAPTQTQKLDVTVKPIEQMDRAEVIAFLAESGAFDALREYEAQQLTGGVVDGELEEEDDDADRC